MVSLSPAGLELTKNDLELLIFPVSTMSYWDYRHIPHAWFYSVLGIKAKA